MIYRITTFLHYGISVVVILLINYWGRYNILESQSRRFGVTGHDVSVVVFFMVLYLRVDLVVPDGGYFLGHLIEGHSIRGSQNDVSSFHFYFLTF